MKINFTKKFMKTLRLSLGLNEREIAEKMSVSVEHYIAFEEVPSAFGGKMMSGYIEFLDSVENAENLSALFLEFAKFDLKARSGAIDIFSRYPLKIVENPEDDDNILSIGG